MTKQSDFGAETLAIVLFGNTELKELTKNKEEIMQGYWEIQHMKSVTKVNRLLLGSERFC